MLASIGLAYAAMSGLCLAMDRHHRQVTGRAVRPGTALVLHLAAGVALVLSFAAAVAAEGWAFGPVAWFGVLTAMGLGLILLLPYRPRLTVGLGLAGLGLALLDCCAPLSSP